MQPMLNIALRAARSAGELIFRSIERLDVISVNEKDAKDYVTEVDRAAEQTIVAALRKAYPTHAIMGEEGGFIEGSGEGADYLWVIDPLDGTTNFIHGVPHFAVSIACKYKGRLEHAVVLDPVRQEEFTASRGRAGAASLDLAYVAAGRYDAFWEFGLSEWDMAAGALLVQEAGGLVSDFTGSHEFLEKGHIVAGNTKCFKALLTTIQPHLPPSLKR
ncbi:inositol monophosphatase [Pseudomonas aeruginosa]|nr:inositol monophosphatase [Pseudomonas aeruginosa]